MNTEHSLAIPVSFSSRRHWLFGAAITIGGLATTPGSANAARTAADEGVSRSTEAIHQENVFKASPKRVYDALTEAQQFQKICILSGAGAAFPLDKKPAEISNELGGAFSIFGAYIIGRQLELIPEKRIVQAWRVTSWPDGIYSIARFQFSPEASGTKIVFDHTGFPDGLGDHLANGWNEHYWQPLVKFLA